MDLVARGDFPVILNRKQLPVLKVLMTRNIVYDSLIISTRGILTN